MLLVLGGLLLLLQLLVPSVAFASSSSTTTKSLPALSSHGVLDLAGVSVVRLEISYRPQRPANTLVQCTALGTLIASWPATSSTSTEQNNWVLTDSSVLNLTGGSCVPGGSLTMIQILASNEFTNHMPALTVLDQLNCQSGACSDQPPGSSKPIAETLASKLGNGGVLFSFHTDASHTLPYLTLAQSSSSASPNGIELATASGPAGTWPADPKISSNTTNPYDFLNPKLGTATAGNSPPTPGVTLLSNEPGMPFVDSNGQVTGMQLSGTGNQLKLAAIQSLEQQEPLLQQPALGQRLSKNTLNGQWNIGIRQYEGGDLPHAIQTLSQPIEYANPSFQAPILFVRMATMQLHKGNNGTPTASPTVGNGQASSSFLGIPTWLVWVVGAMMLVLLFVLVSLVFGGRRAAQKQDRQVMERFKAEEVEARRIADREARRIAEMGAQRQYAQPDATAAPLRSPASDLRCPNCHQQIEETDTYCRNCRYLLSPSAPGLHRHATPPPTAPQAQPQPAQVKQDDLAIKAALQRLWDRAEN